MRPLRSIFLLFLVSILWTSFSEAQHRRLLLDQRSRWDDLKQALEKDTLPPMGMKPWLENTLPGTSPFEHQKSDTGRSLLYRKLFQEHLLRVDREGFLLSVDPLMNFEGGKDLRDHTPYGDTTTLYKNQRGFRVSGSIGDHLSFGSSFIESQVFLPAYLKDYVDQRNVMLGQGRVKPFKETGFDHAMASGYLSYTPWDVLNIQVGHGKHFIGEGYRSLFLSDNAFNYPFARLDHEWLNGRIGYTNLYTGFQSLNRLPKGDAPEALFKPKAGTFHYLDVRVTPGVRLGLFEGIIWERYDSTGTKAFDPNTLDPVIFVNTGMNGFDGKNNALVGMDLRARFSPHALIYGQFLLDDPNKDKWGYQIGIRGMDLGLQGLDIMFEYNAIQPYTYTHRKVLQNYGHYNQPLAHPIGSGLDEFVARLDFNFKRLILKGAYSLALFDQGFNAGHNIYLPDDPGSGPNTDPKEAKLQHQRVELGYLINPSNDLRITGGVDRRNFSVKGEEPDETLYLYISLKTMLPNSYSDL